MIARTSNGDGDCAAAGSQYPPLLAYLVHPAGREEAKKVGPKKKAGKKAKKSAKKSAKKAPKAKAKKKKAKKAKR